MNLPRLIATDLDGTLLRTDGSISTRTHDVLQRVEAGGIQLVLVTGRPIRRMREIATWLGLDGVAICGNGALVYDLGRDEVLEHTQLSAAVLRELITDLRAGIPEISFAIETGFEVGREPAYARQRGLVPELKVEMADALELCARGASKLIASHPSLAHEELYAQARALVAERASVTHSGAPFLEIAAKGVTKAWALAGHCRKRGIEPSDVLAFGDMPNDLPMLEWAGRGVAVANAHPAVLAIANAVTGTNDEDGVAEYLERHVLGEA
jgi:HAD superfamily hydrolase (TIGR01484 family)